MSKVNRPDTLHGELRELRRRIRLLESAAGRGSALPGSPASGRPGEAVGDGGPSGASWALPMLPARPVDWWSVSGPEWERVAVLWLPPSDPGWMVQVTVADGTGAVRLTRDGDSLSPAMPVAASGRPESFWFTSAVPGGGQLEVEASGTFRMIAEVRTT